MKELSRHFGLTVLTVVMLIRMSEGGALAKYEREDHIIHHLTDPDPQRHNYIWNPFPGLCGPNATRVICGGVCPETCQYKSLYCVSYCGVPCKCKRGFIFNELSLQCILRSDCPSHVGPQKLIGTHRVFQ
ncbi:uncharacterized protein [Drosophila tropicalis]|uniref:uncharacterized protein n=1 Tax=Drosophila tropicalis TaxID=46794 RepID=UPI0035ABB807